VYRLSTLNRKGHTTTDVSSKSYLELSGLAKKPRFRATLKFVLQVRDMKYEGSEAANLRKSVVGVMRRRVLSQLIAGARGSLILERWWEDETHTES